MKLQYLIIAFAIWIVLSVVLFASRSSSTQPVHDVCEPQRIISTAPNLTEILFALNLDERIVGVSRNSNYPPESEEKPKIGTFWQPNIEAVIAAKPQLIVTLSFEQQINLAHRLDRMGFNTLTVKIEDLGDLYTAIEKIGTSAGRMQAARQVIDSIKTNLNNLSKKVRAYKKPGTLWVVQRRPLRVAGPDTFISRLIQIAGGKNVVESSIYKYPPIGAEQLYACNPEVIIEASENCENLREQRKEALEYYKKFKGLSAVENRRIHVIDADSVSRLGPRIDSGAEKITECLHPALTEPACGGSQLFYDKD